MKKTNDAQYEANRLADAFLAVGKVDSLSKSQEVLAKIKGFNNWHELQQNFKQNKNRNYSINLDIDMDERAQFFLQNLPIEVVNCKPISIPIRNNEINTTEYVLETKQKKLTTVKSIFKKTAEVTHTTIKTEDFPILAIGFIGAGIVDSFYGLQKQIIAEGSGCIDVNANGCNTSYIKTFSLAKSLNREKDVFVLNFINDSRQFLSSDKQTHTINPLEHFLLNKENFSNYFGKEISQWLYPALKSYENKEQRVKLNSIKTFLTLPQLLLMANSNDWNNKQETLEYLQSIGIHSEDEKSDEVILNAIKIHMIKTDRTYKQISYIENPGFSYVFSDEPEIHFVEIISQKKICNILMPCLEKCSDELWCLTEIINQMLLAADSIVGHDNCFYFFQVSGEMGQTKSPSIYLAQEWEQQKRILTFHENPDKILKPDPLFYKSYIILKQEDPNCEIYELVLNMSWNQANNIKTIAENNPKYFTEGHALLIKGLNSNFCNIQKIIFDYHQIKNAQHIYINRIEK